MGKIFKFRTKEELLQHLHAVKERKKESEAAAKAEFRALQKETESLRNEIYATIEY